MRKNLLVWRPRTLALEEYMLEWKPKLVTLVVALALVAMLVGFGLVHVTSLSTDVTNFGW